MNNDASRATRLAAAPQGWKPMHTAPLAGEFLACIEVTHGAGKGPTLWHQHVLMRDDEDGSIHTDYEQGWDLEDYHGWQALPPAPDAAPAASSPDPKEQSMSLPEHDAARSNREQGLYRKFDVRRTDGSDRPGGKHDGCDYFVLDVTHDPHAKAALLAYARACEATHPQLAADMQVRYGVAASSPEAVDERVTAVAGQTVALPRGLIEDLLVAADLLSRRWKAQNAEVGRRLAAYVNELTAAPVASVAAPHAALASAPEAADERAETLRQSLRQFERLAHRAGELWERCQGIGWPDAESEEFTSLRDERLPALRAQLLSAALASAPAGAGEGASDLHEAVRKHVRDLRGCAQVLRSEFSGMDAAAAEFNRACDELEAALAGEPAVAADEGRDAARYRWLRAEHQRVDPVCHLTWKRNSDRSGNVWVNTADLDAAIDAARAAGEAP